MWSFPHPSVNATFYQYLSIFVVYYLSIYLSIILNYYLVTNIKSPVKMGLFVWLIYCEEDVEVTDFVRFDFIIDLIGMWLKR